MIERIEIGDLEFGFYEQASDAFGNFLHKLPEGLAFAGDGWRRNRLGLTHNTMLALYDFSIPRKLFAKDVNPERFYVLRNKHLDRVFVAEYHLWHGDSMMVPFDYRICLSRMLNERKGRGRVLQSIESDVASKVSLLN